MMSNHATFLFLGTGGSMGIPVIGCHCGVCLSDSPCNKRLRPSAIISIDSKRFLIDCGPDFRIQALTHHIDSLDGLLLTHAHHDHIAGIDELRVFHMYNKKPLPCLLSEDTGKDLQNRYRYIFENHSPHKLTPHFQLQILTGERGITEFQGLEIKYMTYEQAGMKVNGFRIGNFAYVSDIKEYPETIFEDLKGVEILVMSALRFTVSPVHLSIDEAIQFATKINAKHTWLTHIAHELDHEKTNAYLPSNIRMAYDGLDFTFNHRNFTTEAKKST